MSAEVWRSGALGLSLSENAVTAVQIVHGSDGLDVSACATVHVPGVGRLYDPDLLTQAIRGVWRKAGFRGTAVAVSLDPLHHGYNILRLPSVPERERRAMVRSELEATDTLRHGHGSFGFIWPSGVEAGARSEAFVWHAGDAAVEAVRGAVEAAGLRVIAMEPACVALVRAHLATHGSPGPLAFLLPGRRYSDLTLFDGLRVNHVRRIPAGVEADAEEPEPESDFQAMGSSEVGGALAASVPHSEPGSHLPGEVARSLALYRRHHREEPQPAAVVLVGSEEMAERAISLFAGRLSAPVAVSDPPFRLTTSCAPASEDTGGAMAAIGAAAGAAGLECGIPPVDLSVQEAAARARFHAPRIRIARMTAAWAWLGAAVAVAAALLALGSAAEGASERMARELAALEATRAPLIRRAQLANVGRAMRDVTSVRPGEVLDAITRSKPEGVLLRGVRLTAEGALEIDGWARSSETLRVFTLGLAAGGAVLAPEVGSFREENEGLLSFRMVGRTRDDGGRATRPR